MKKRTILLATGGMIFVDFLLFGVGLFILSGIKTSGEEKRSALEIDVAVEAEVAPDTTPPEIVLEGDAEIGLFEGRSFFEPGFTARDDVDGELTEKVETSGEVDTNRAGVYKLKYSVRDEAGNLAETTRLVFVYKTWYTFQSTPTKNFEELEAYIKNNGWDISFGYYNFQTGRTYMFQGEKVYYGASLVKTADAMYAFETGDVDATSRALVRRAITYSDNSAHIALVQRFGIENLRRYGEQIGMKKHLKGSELYGGTYYFCDTTVEDQLAEWKHLWELINNSPHGEELRLYFINNFWDNLSFSGSPVHMYKNGLYGNNYHEVGIIFADSPYAVVMLSTEGWRSNSTTIVKDLSHRIFMIHQLVVEGEV
ncbi:DUF5011 domain-containing protein [Candidatus Saccharibacteria bacterium]|nr:DUF5011 domain-containing protein [Candidatus Saccharibacteria bacterium]